MSTVCVIIINNLGHKNVINQIIISTQPKYLLIGPLHQTYGHIFFRQSGWHQT